MSKENGSTGASVLIVDDSPDVRQLLTSWIALGDTFSVAAEAADGAEAIMCATRYQPDVIVLDVMMPVLGGIDALPAIRSGAPHAKVVVYSAFTDDPVLEKIYDAGAHAVVNKAAPIEQLFLTMSEVLHPL